MQKPVIIVVDDHENDLALIEHELNKRYGADYQVIAEKQPQQAIETIQRLKQDQRDLVMFLANQWLAEIEGIFLLGQVQGIYPTARRILTINWGDRSTTQPIMLGMALGIIDEFIPKPFGHRRRTFTARSPKRWLPGGSRIRLDMISSRSSASSGRPARTRSGISSKGMGFPTGFTIPNLQVVKRSWNSTR